MVPTVVFINLHLSPSVLVLLLGLQSWYITVMTDELSNADLQKQDVSSHFFPLRSQIYIAAKSFSFTSSTLHFPRYVQRPHLNCIYQVSTTVNHQMFGLIVYFSFLTSLCLCSQTGFLLRRATMNHEEKLKYSYLFLLLCTLHIL